MPNRLTGLLEEKKAASKNRLAGLLHEKKQDPLFPQIGRRVVVPPEKLDDAFTGRAPIRDMLPPPLGLQMGTIVDMSRTPADTEADIGSALMYSIEMDAPLQFDKTFSFIDEMNKIAQEGKTGETAWKRIQARYRAGKTQVNLGDLGFSILRQSWSDPDAFEQSLKEIEQLQTDAGDPDVQAKFRGFWEKTFGAAAELLPQMGETLKAAPAGAVLGGFAGGVIAALGGVAIPTVGEEAPLIGGGIATGMKYGAGAAGAARISELEAGHQFVSLMTMKDAQGNRMDPKMAVVISHAVGVINGGIEVAQWVTALKAFGITDQLWKSASRKVMRDLAKRGALKTIALETVENFGVAISAETMQEVGQESTNIVFEALAVELNRAKGKDFPHITADALIQRYNEVTEQSLRAFGVLLAPGIGISGAVQGMQVRAAQTDEKARKQQIRIARRELGGITVERQALPEEAEQVGIETEIAPGVFEKLTTGPRKAAEPSATAVTTTEAAITPEKRTQAIERVRGILSEDKYASLDEQARGELGQKMLAQFGVEAEISELTAPEPPATAITPEDAGKPTPAAEKAAPEGKKVPPISQAGGIATEKLTPNLYIGNVTPGMKKRIAESGEFSPEDIQGFKEEGFPTKRTQVPMTRAEAGNYLTWAIGAIDNIVQEVEAAGEIAMTNNQIAMTQALIGDIKAVQDALGYEVKPAQLTVRRATKLKAKLSGEVLQRMPLELATRVSDVLDLTSKQAVEQFIKPTEKVEKTTYEIFRDTMKNVSEASEKAYLVGARETVKQHKNLAVLAKEKLGGAEVTKGERNRLLSAVARARTEKEQIHAMAAVEAIADKAKKRAAAKRITQQIPEAVDFAYREAIEALREGIDPKFRSRKTIETKERTRQFLDRHPEMVKEMPTKLINKLNRKPISEFTIQELEEVADAIDTLVKQGKLKRKLALSTEAAKLAKKKDAMLDSITKGEPLKADDGPKVFDTTQEGLVITTVQKTRAWTLRPSRIFDMLDGRQDFSGPNHSFFVDTTNRLTDAKWRDSDRRTDAGKVKQKELGITAHDLSAVRVVNDVRYTVDEMIDIYAKEKNVESKLALIKDNNISEADIDAVITELSENEKAWGDYIIKDYDNNYARLRQSVIEVENRDMGFAENYTPMRRTDIDYSTHTEEIIDAIMQRETLRKAYAEKGFTIKRTGGTTSIKLGITQMWFGQVPKQEQYIHLAQHIRDMHRIVDSAEFSKTVKQQFGNEFNKVIKDYVNRVANPNIYRSFSSLENLSRHLRQNAAIAYLAYNLVTMAKQLPSAFLYLQDAGAIHLLSSAGQFVAHPFKVIQKVRDLDPQVKHKAIERELEELRKAHGSTYTQVLKRFGEVGMHGIYMLDTVARTIGWNAVYEKALASDKSEAEAIRLAQNATLRTQPVATAKDLPALYATSEFAHWFTMFTNQLNQIYNIATYDIPSYVTNKKYGNAALAIAGMGITALTIWMMSHKDIPDEPEDFLEAAGEQAINAIPLVGKAIMAGRRGWGDTDIPAFESSKAVGRSVAAIERGEFTDYDLKVVVEGFAVSVGVPYIGPKRVLTAIKEGEPSALLGGKQKKKQKRLTLLD